MRRETQNSIDKFVTDKFGYVDLADLYFLPPLTPRESYISENFLHRPSLGIISVSLGTNTELDVTELKRC